MLQSDLTVRKVQFRSSLPVIFNQYVYFLINCNQNYKYLFDSQLKKIILPSKIILIFSQARILFFQKTFLNLNFLQALSISLRYFILFGAIKTVNELNFDWR
jgi:hypothetical protein